MKTTLLILLGGVFLAVVLSDTAPQDCKAYEVSVECGQCDQTCNQPQIFCSVLCTPGVTYYCRCKKNYSRISKSNQICVPNEWCPLFAEKNCTTKTT